MDFINTWGPIVLFVGGTAAGIWQGFIDSYRWCNKQKEDPSNKRILFFFVLSIASLIWVFLPFDFAQALIQAIETVTNVGVLGLAGGWFFGLFSWSHAEVEFVNNVLNSQTPTEILSGAFRDPVQHRRRPKP